MIYLPSARGSEAEPVDLGSRSSDRDACLLGHSNAKHSQIARQKSFLSTSHAGHLRASTCREQEAPELRCFAYMGTGHVFGALVLATKRSQLGAKMHSKFTTSARIHRCSFWRTDLHPFGSGSGPGVRCPMDIGVLENIRLLESL